MSTIRSKPPPHEDHQANTNTNPNTTNANHHHAHHRNKQRGSDERRRVSPRNDSIASSSRSSYSARNNQDLDFATRLSTNNRAKNGHSADHPGNSNGTTTPVRGARRVTSDVRHMRGYSNATATSTVAEPSTSYQRKQSELSISSRSSNVLSTGNEEVRMTRAAKLRQAAGRDKAAAVEKEHNKDSGAFRLANTDNNKQTAAGTVAPARSRSRVPHKRMAESVKRFGMSLTSLHKKSAKPENNNNNNNNNKTESNNNNAAVESNGNGNHSSVSSNSITVEPASETSKPRPPPKRPQNLPGINLNGLSATPPERPISDAPPPSPHSMSKAMSNKSPVNKTSAPRSPHLNGTLPLRFTTSPSLSIDAKVTARVSTGSMRTLNLSSVPKNSTDDMDDERAEISRKRAKLAEVQFECSEVVPGLFVGGLSVAHSKDILKRCGITHVLNCAGMVVENKFPNDFDYKTLYLADGPQEDLECVLYESLRFIINAIGDGTEANKGSGGAVFVHCQQGVSRSPSICIAYLMATRGLSYDQGCDVVRTNRSVCKPNIGFMCQLVDWGKRLQHGITKQPILFKVTPQSQFAPTHLVCRRVRRFTSADLDSTTCFMLHTSDTLFRWIGSAASPESLCVAEAHESDLQRFEKGGFPSVLVMDGDEPPEFWAHFPDRGGDSSGASTPNGSSSTVVKSEEGAGASFDGSEAGLGQVDVFLGGACNPTTWRKDVALPILHQHGITYFNPQVDEWHPGLVAVEAHHKHHAPILVFVVDSSTRGIASLVEGAECVCVSPTRVLLVVLDVSPTETFGASRDPDSKELRDLNRGREYLRDIARRRAVPVFDSLQEAMDELVKRFRVLKAEREKQKR